MAHPQAPYATATRADLKLGVLAARSHDHLCSVCAGGEVAVYMHRSAAPPHVKTSRTVRASDSGVNGFCNSPVSAFKISSSTAVFSE